MAQQVLDRRPGLKEYEIFKEADTKALTKSILERKIDWQQLRSANLLSPADAGLLLDYDKKTKQEQAQLLTEQGKEYAAMFVRCLSTLQSEEPVRYLLALVDDLLEEDSSRARYFNSLDGDDLNPYTPFIKMLSRADVSKALPIHILAILLGSAGATANDAMPEFLNWLITHVESSKGAEQINVVNAIKTMLKKSYDAQLVFIKEGGLKHVCALLSKETQNTQLLYHAVFCFFVLSFNREVKLDLLEHDVVVRLVDLLKAGPREKIMRVIFGTLRNLLDVPAFGERMLSSGLNKLLPALQNRKLNDDDLVEDIKIVDETLEKYTGLLSSYERYKAEVESGQLEWSPVHSERFWRENNGKFEADNYSLISFLVRHLNSQTPLTLEVACYDLGEFARFHPEGRKIVSNLGGKKRLMLMMKHENPKVAKEALLAVQKLMVHNWESFTVMGRS